MKKNIHRSISPSSCFVGGCVIGVFCFFAINTAASLKVTNDAWILQGYVERDIIQHYLGWLFYRSSDWQFPLGIASQMNYPNGVAISFTDSIPLIAIPLRFFSSLLPQTFQYFGWYTLLCYLLQGGASALLLQLFEKSYFKLFCGVLLFITAPIFVERTFRHTALASHYLILFALYLYFSNQKNKFHFHPGYLILLVLATCIHPYFLPMLFGILFADLIQHIWKTHTFLPSFGFLCAAFFSVLVIAYIIGIFSSSGSDNGGSSGYGYFCMNLNSLFNPSSIGNFVWSRFFKLRPTALGSYDGFNYMGLGVLFSLPIGGLLLLTRKGISGVWSLFRRHWGLAFVCVCFTVFAISNTIIYSGLVIISIPLPTVLQQLCDIFRSSGRMFYPVYYLLILFAFVQLKNIPHNALSYIAVFLILSMQLWDISPALQKKRSAFTQNTLAVSCPMQSEAWQFLSGQYKHLYVLDESPILPLYPALFAAQNGMTDNSNWAARVDTAKQTTAISSTTEQLLAGQIDENTLYLTRDECLAEKLSIALVEKAVVARIDSIWYLILPKISLIPAASCSFRIYPEIPPIIGARNTDYWTAGISNSNHSIISFHNTLVNRSKLQAASALLCNGMQYTISSISYAQDECGSWIEVELAIEDASILQGCELIVTEENG